MSTLTIHLEGPQQFWSAGIGMRERRTLTRPSKSAVIGLVANALGRTYEDSINDLSSLRFAVSEIQAGSVEHDYKTVGTAPMPALPRDVLAGMKLDKNPVRAGEHWVSTAPRNNVDRSKTEKDSLSVPKSGVAKPKLLTEEYLSDAVFNVILEGPLSTLSDALTALHRPARAIYLGRRAYSASERFVDDTSLRDSETMEEALARYDDHDVWCEVKPGTEGARFVDDQPVEFGPRQRRGKRAELFIPRQDNDFFDF